jgi:hypothetical protein
MTPMCGSNYPSGHAAARKPEIPAPGNRLCPLPGFGRRADHLGHNAGNVATSPSFHAATPDEHRAANLDIQHHDDHG